MIQGLNHIGIAVEDLDAAVALYRDKLGLRFEGIDEVPTERVRVAMFYAGETRIELLQGTSEDSPIAKFVAKRGPGIHHLAFTTGDAQGAIQKLSAEDLRLLDETPRPGAHDTKVAFVHPKSMLGVLTELVEMPR
jgi:methylmalonyl-CoA/ethylmalonyl-CoA epimerase